MVRDIWGVIALATLMAFSAGRATADDQIHYGPIPAWVKVATPDPAPAGEDEGFARLVLFDTQTRHGADGDDIYTDRAFQVLTRQGLEALGTIGQIWSPETQTLTVHKVEIIRGGEVIDALAKGDPLIVLRQEASLSQAVLTGQLTATKQLEDVRVGDIVRVVSSVHQADPMMKGHSQSMSVIPPMGTTAYMRERHLWAADRRIRWRAADGYPKPVQTRTAEGFELVAEARNVKAPVPPAGAPSRYGLIGLMTVSDFADWREVSALFAADYAAAATLKSDSPIKAEARTIMQAHATAEDRASAALALVQERVRYLALAMGQGGYKPADADLTWSRKFGDCKGKSALLVALLSEMGIGAEVMAVSSGGGDGLDTLLPSLAAFDHVIVRTTIGGKTYWLDPTRFGDARIADLDVPAYRWVLPIRAAGADLEALRQTAPNEPRGETLFEADFSAGLDVDAPLHVRVTYRGDDAAMQHAEMSAGPRAQTEAALKESWTTKSWLIDKATFGRNEDGSVFVDVTGRLKAVWPRVGAARQFKVWNSSIDPSFDDRDPEALNPKAPYAINYPHYRRYLSRVRLPRDGEGFELLSRDVDIKAAGLWIQRRARIEKGVLIVEEDDRTTAPEVAFADAAPDLARLKASGVTEQVMVRAPSNFRMTAEEADKAVETRPGRDTYMLRAFNSMAAGDHDKALADLNKVIEENPKDLPALSRRAWILGQRKDYDAAFKDWAVVLEATPQDVGVLIERAGAYLAQGRTDLALADYDAAVKARPGDWGPLVSRAVGRDRAGDVAGAKADMAEAARLAPDNIALNEDNIWRQYDGPGDDAARNAAFEAFYARQIAAAPKSASLYLKRGKWRDGNNDHKGALADFDKAIDLDPTAPAYLARAESHRQAKDKAKALADFDQAVKLDTSHRALLARARYSAMEGTPGQWLADARAASTKAPQDTAAMEEVVRAALVAGDISKARDTVDDLTRLRPTALEALRLRALVKAQAGDLSGAVADMRLALQAPGAADEEGRKDARLRLAGLLADSGRHAEAIAALADLKKAYPKDADILGRLCRLKAARDLETASAVDDCDAALAISPDDADHLDSLGLANLRLGRFDHAIAAYDESLKLRPGQTTALYGRALAREGAGDLAGAREDARLAARFDRGGIKEVSGYGLTARDEGVIQALAVKAADPETRFPKGAVIKRPDWADAPPAPDYPERALDAEREGRVWLSCIVMAGGQLSNCQVDNERPQDYGFGAAVLKATKDMRMRPMTVDGQAVDGGEIRFATPFLLE